MSKLALAMIVKGSDAEADALRNCLNNVSRHVDGIFITRTHKKGEKPNKKVKEVAELYGAQVSEFEWINDFAAARNFNFSQVPKEFTHILWADADDVFRGLEKLKPTLKEHLSVDVFSMFYFYDFDEWKRPTVVHQKSMVVKNNGCVEWAGRLHEDFRETRAINRHFIKGIERIHQTNDERIEVARERNAEVAEAGIDANPDDPRSYWNLGNAYFSVGKTEESRNAFETFLEMSLSDEEKYTARLRLAHLEDTIGNIHKAIDHLRYAIGIRPAYPDAYHQLGQLYYNNRQYSQAAEMIVNGLTKKPPYFQTIVYNPRDYDYNPLMLLAKTYIALSRPDHALTCLESAAKIHPADDGLKKVIKNLRKEAETFDDVLKTIKTLSAIKDKKKLKKKIDALPEDIRSHPQICLLHNQTFVKDKSSEKDLVYFCGYTEHPWNPELFKEKGFGGSEEAVVNLAKAFSDAGWNVTVYNNPGHHTAKEYDGVTYAPYWMWNYRDKQDVTVLWRGIRAVDYEINSDRIIVDLHDVVQEGEFTEERLEKVEKIFVKTNFHRSLFPKVPDNKFATIPNGMDFSLFEQEAEKDRYLLVNTSSPDRSLDVLPELFERVKKRVPQARLKWAYGWEIFDVVHKDDAKAMEWKQDRVKKMKEVGIEELGRVTQKEAARLYIEGNILAYPTEFAEIDCITVKKAQACGCIPVTTDFAALDESVQYGVKIHSEKTKDDWCPPYTFHFGLQDKEAQDKWVDAVVEHLENPVDNRDDMKEWTKKFSWEVIAKQWLTVLEQ